jgi:hypothetical protein
VPQRLLKCIALGPRRKLNDPIPDSERSQNSSAVDCRCIEAGFRAVFNGELAIVAYNVSFLQNQNAG